MKYRIMKFINNIKNFLVNIKIFLKKFILENKILSLILGVVLFIIIIGILIISNTKTEIGNTSGNLNNSGFSVQKDGWVYYLGFNESNTDGIYRIKLNGDKREKINSEYALYLNRLGKFIYYLDRSSANYNIARMKTNGEEKEIIINDVDIAKITVVDNWIYYFKESKLYRANTNGEEKQIISNKAMENYEIVGDWIYYSYINDGKNVIAKMRTNGEEISKIDGDSAPVFFLNNNYIYYIYEKYNEQYSEYNYELYKVKTNGKNKEKIIDMGKGVQLENMNFDENRIYYTKIDENNILSIYSIKLDGKDEKKIVEIKGNYTLVNVHEGWIYYTDENDNGDSQMFRIKINGRDKQSL